MKKVLLVVILAMLLSLSVEATDVLMVKQNVGRSSIFYWFHNEEVWGSEVLYINGDSPALLVGMSPFFQIQAGDLKIKIINYFTATSDLGKTRWPVKSVGIDNFLSFALKDWSLLLRITPDFGFAKKKMQYSGRDYLGYRLSEKWQVQAQTEWVYSSEKKLSQTVGLGWAHAFTKQLGFDGYLGIDPKSPHKKAGWFLLKLTME